jgi:hypothetical protein
LAFDDATYDGGMLAVRAPDARSWRPKAARPAWLLAEIGVAGGLAALLLVFFWLDLRPDIHSAHHYPFFWLKMAYTAALAAAGFDGLTRLIRRGPPAPTAIFLAVVAVLTFVVGGVIETSQLAPAQLAKLFSPASVGACFFNIVALALPTLFLALTALRGVETERPLLAGFAAGVFAGGLGASVYGLHCPHSTFVFVGLWYLGGVLLCGLAGAALNRLAAR